MIGGAARGRQLKAKLPAAVRPTTDYAREAIFSMLESRGGLAGLRVVDLYCGSGAMGIEALSRGAAAVYFVDADPHCLSAAKSNLELVEDAWRFGVAQLHQLRGRVGRAEHQSYCYLLGEPPSDDGRERLEAVTTTSDGFALAEIDFVMRGEGTLLGSRQRGRSDLRLAKLRDDGDLLDAARQLAADIVAAGGATLDEMTDELRLFVDAQEAAYLFKS